MKLKYIFAALFLFASAAPLGAASPEMLLRERCYQGECTFTKIIQTKTIGRNAGGYLLQVKARSVAVGLKQGESEKIPAPKNFGIVRVVYIYCSTTKPALIFYDSKKFYAHIMNIGETPAGYEIGSHIEYWAACHDRIVSVGDVTEGKLAEDAAGLGYKKLPDGERQQRGFRSKKKAFRYFGL